MPLDASILLSSPDALRAVVDALPRRSAARFARTSHGFLSPGLGVVWRELDSLVPLVALFPAHIFKKAKRPGMGLASMPSQADWTRVLAYAPLVRSLTYDESSRTTHPSLFPVLASSPGGTLLPRLRALTWRAETSAGLARAAPFLSSAHLHALALTLGPKAVIQLAELLAAPEAEALRLAVFDLVAAAPVPPTILEAFPDAFAGLERLSLSMPELLSSAMGVWIARLPCLHALELDLAGASIQDVKGFFVDMPGVRPSRGSGRSSPTMDTDSGIFSGEGAEEEDNAAAGPGALPGVQALKLRGAARAIAEFLKHLTPGALTKLQLSLADPPEPADWADVLELLGCCFGASLTSFTVGAAETVVEGKRPPRRLCLDALARVYLPALTTFCVDMHCASMITDTDLYHLARACPALHILYLPLLPPTPRASLDGLAFLTARCPSLYSISLSLDARQPPSDGVFFDLGASSRTLRVLDVGNSYAGDALQAAVALSHLAPHLETLRYAEGEDVDERAWAECARTLPALQGVRLTERWIAMTYMPEARDLCDQCVETDEVQDVAPAKRTLDYGVQVAPEVAEQEVLAIEDAPKRSMAEIAIDATGPPPTPKVVRFSPTNDYFDLEDHDEEDELNAEEREWEALEASIIEIKAMKDEREAHALEAPVVEVQPPTPIQCADDRNGSPIFSFDDITSFAEDMQDHDSGEDSSVTEEIVFNVEPAPLPPPQTVDIVVEGMTVEDEAEDEAQRPTIDLVAVDTGAHEVKRAEEDATPEDETLPTEYSTPITEPQDDPASRGVAEDAVSAESDALESEAASSYEEADEDEVEPLITREISESPIIDALEASEEIDAPPPRHEVQTPPPPYALTHADSSSSSQSNTRTSNQHQQHTAMLDAPTPPTQLYIPHVVSRSVDLAWKIAFFGPNFMTARVHDIWALSPLGPGGAHWLQGEKTQNQPQSHSRLREGEMEVMDISDDEEEKSGGSAIMRNGISPVCM